MTPETRSLITVALREAAEALREEGRHTRAATCDTALQAIDADTDLSATPGLGKRVHFFTALSRTDIAAELCRRIATGKPLGDYHEQTPAYQGIPGELDTIGEAKEIARALLDAAKANGLGGCKLCQS